MAFNLEEKYNLIKQDIINFTSKNPLAIVCEMMKKQYINIHGPEHHFLDGAAFLVAFKNAGGKIDTDKYLNILAERTIKMPGAMCAYWGICGAVASVGAALSIINGTQPLSTDEHYKYNMEYTSEVLHNMSKIGGARCCKRNAFLSLTNAVKFANQKYYVDMEFQKVECEFSSLNAQCLSDKCPFYKH